MGGEFIAGPQLMAALNFAVGSVMACIAAIGGGTMPANPMPPMLDIEPEPARERYGWYIDRAAFGPDLYVVGRQTPLALRSGGATTAQRQLDLGWAAGRTALHPLLTPADAAQVDAMVAGDLPLPVEAPAAPTRAVGSAPQPDPAAEAMLAPLNRPQFELAPVMVTWEMAVLLVAGTGREEAAFLTVPSRTWPAFVEALRQGRLDAAVAGYLALRSRRRRLDRRSKALQVGLYDALGPRRNLLAPEPVSDPRAGRADVRAAIRRFRARLSGGTNPVPARATLARGPGA